MTKLNFTEWYSLQLDEMHDKLKYPRPEDMISQLSINNNTLHQCYVKLCLCFYQLNQAIHTICKSFEKYDKLKCNRVVSPSSSGNVGET